MAQHEPNMIEALRLSLEAASGRKVYMIDKAIQGDGRISEPTGAIYLSLHEVEMAGHYTHDGFILRYALHVFVHDNLCGELLPTIWSMGLSSMRTIATASRYYIGDRIINNLLTIEAESIIKIATTDIAQRAITAIKLGDNITITISDGQVTQKQGEEI